jgi:hypothetical protein
MALGSRPDLVGQYPARFRQIVAAGQGLRLKPLRSLMVLDTCRSNSGMLTNTGLIAMLSRSGKFSEQLDYVKRSADGRFSMTVFS